MSAGSVDGFVPSTYLKQTDYVLIYAPEFDSTFCLCELGDASVCEVFKRRSWHGN
jgi:hypothetical protein